MKSHLPEETLKDVDHDARPEIGMVISLKTSLCEKVAVTGQKVTLVLDTACDKLKPFLARFFISTTPCI